MCFSSFPSHRKEEGFGTAGEALCIQRTVRSRQGKPSVEWDKSFFKRRFLKEVFVDLNRIKRRITEESFGINERVV